MSDMSDKTTYFCKICGTEKTLSPDDTLPVCCNETMEPAEPLPVCQAPFGSENSRFGDDGGPCDDGRSG